MQINWLAVFGAALIPLLVGMIWYNKNVFGTVWMKAAGVDPEQAKNPISGLFSVQRFS